MITPGLGGGIYFLKNLGMPVILFICPDASNPEMVYIQHGLYTTNVLHKSSKPMYALMI